MTNQGYTHVKSDAKLFRKRGTETHANINSKKITIVGLSETGMAIALCILTRGLTRNLCYLDLDKKKISNEMLDFQHAGYHMARSTEILYGNDFSLSAGSDICLITISLPYSDLYHELECYEVIEKYIDIFKSYIPNLIKYNPRTVLFVLTKPNSIMTYVAWRLSRLPKYKVFGIGTHDETARYRHALAMEWGVAASEVRAYIIGKKYRGFPLIESASVNGILLNEFVTDKCALCKKQIDLYNEINDRNLASEEAEKFTIPPWGLALTCAKIINAVIYNSDEIFTVCVYAKGIYNIDKEVFLAVPVIINRNGISRILSPIITREQKKMLKDMANDCHDVHINLDLV